MSIVIYFTRCLKSFEFDNKTCVNFLFFGKCQDKIKRLYGYFFHVHSHLMNFKCDQNRLKLYQITVQQKVTLNNSFSCFVVLLTVSLKTWQIKPGLLKIYKRLFPFVSNWVLCIKDALIYFWFILYEKFIFFCCC